MPDSGVGRSEALPEIHAGFIPLTDCAPLAVAKELGFDQANDFNLVLHREVSWANIRDKVEAGLFDCAIMLAPMPLASTLGLGGRPAGPIIAAMATSLNGNAITVSRGVYDEMLKHDSESAENGGAQSAKCLARVIAQRRTGGLEALTLGMVHPFSCHNYELRNWLAGAGINPDEDVNLVVVPPPLIAASLKSGRIDGFCVGEPWNSVAVADGSGVIVATKAELWGASPEKVLGLQRTFAEHNSALTLKLIRALVQACAWLDEPQNRFPAARLLAEPRFLGVPEAILGRALTNDLDRGTGRMGNSAAQAIIFKKEDANVPRHAHAAWLLAQMIRWGQVRAPFDIAEIARETYRPDLHLEAVSGAGSATCDALASTAIDAAFFAAEHFDPDAPLAYLAGLAMRDSQVDLSLFGP